MITQVNKNKIMPFAVIAIGILVIILIKVSYPRPKPQAPAEPAIPSVPVAYANPIPTALTVYSQGTVQPKREIDLAAQVGGQIVGVAQDFANGGGFERGDMLLNIDPRDYEFALARAKAQLASAKEALASEKGRVRQAKREWRDLGDREANDLFLRKPQLAAAKANLIAAQAERDQAELNLQRTTVTIPFNGRIKTTYVNLGQYITPGTAIAKVFDSSSIEIRLPLTDKQASLLDLGNTNNATNNKPKVRLHGQVFGQNQTWQANIVRTEANLDTQSRFYYAVAEIIPDNKNLSLPPIGSFVEAHIIGRVIADVVELPKSAILNRNMIYSINSENKVFEQKITVLQANGKTVWIKGDIQTQQVIVISQQALLRPGITVQVNTEESG